MRAVLAFALVLCTGCAGGLDITRTVSVNDASSNLSAQAIVRDGERIDLPAGTHVRAGRAVLPASNVANIALEPGDEVVRHGDDIVGVRSHGAITVHFSSAELVEPSTVRGEISDIPLRNTDSIEVRGTFMPGDDLPGGGHVESSRWTSALIGGITIFALAYAPSVWVGAQSSGDHALLAPIVGPWIDLANRPACATSSQVVLAASTVGVDPCLGDTAMRIALVASGVAQGLGALLTVLGLPAHSEVIGTRTGSFHVSLVPTGLGGSLVGSF